MLHFSQQKSASVWNVRKIFSETLGLFSATVLLFCAEYFTIGITLWTSWVGAIMLIVGYFFVRRPTLSFPRHIADRLLPQTILGIMLFGISLFSFLTILLTTLYARTGEALVSPWNILPGALFILYGIGLFCTMLVGRVEQNRAALPLGMLFILTSTAISALIYSNGFGFDPFLHRAAETALVQHGSISPLQILYSGQYALVAALHHLTQLPLWWIDIWLVPLLASWFLPLGVIIGLEDGWKISQRNAATWWPIIFLVPFSLITFTVPFTITYVFFLLFCALWPTLSQGSGALLLPLFAAIFFHPLLAVPMFLFGLGIFLRSRIKNRTGAIIGSLSTVILMGISVPLMLVLGHASPTAPHLSSLFEQRELFFNLFRSPYMYSSPLIPWELNALYEFRYWLPMALFMFGLLLTVTQRYKTLRIDIWIFVAGMMLTIWGTSTLFSFQNIIAHEQGEFALRLLQALFTFPLLIFAVSIPAMINRRRWMALPLLGLISACVTVSWYFSYPQFNEKYPFFSPGVSDDDIAAVHAIETRSRGDSYIVLVHQMTSVAAIQEFGFSQMITLDGESVLRYPIPTGGKLYPYYIDLLYHGVTREKLDILQAKSHVEHIYVITHDYWQWSPDMLQSLAESADSHFREAHLTVWAFDY